MSWLEMLWLLLLLITLGGVAIGRLPRLAMNRATICLAGATLLVLSGAIPYHEALQAIDLHTLTLLLAMMIINIHLRMAGFFSWVAYHTTAAQLHPRLLLALLMLVSALLSALFLNDTIVLAFTPLVLEVVLMAGLPPIPFLIGLATAANIGSVATLIGNPQNMLIGIASAIPFTPFLQALAPVALGSLLIAWLLLLLLYPKQLSQRPIALPPPAPLHMHHTLLRKSLLVTLLLLATLLAGMPVSLAAISAATPLLITRRWPADEILQEIDWPLLLFFAALFIVTRAVESSGFSHSFLQLLPAADTLQLPALAWSSMLLSNLVSNVPAVLLLKPLVSQLPWAEKAWLTLAMATTLAGNLTLLGSVANLIVAESARKQGVTLGFWPYLRAGLPITLLTLFWGIYWLSRPT
ncbi:anion transporter [Candidatus Magnetaquicoccus inordinatus]|uniref:anion transporter n=1 Tax=Candidatus Magnetaquicoccus inordinatus TaxID=2496818 RepID=UPI00102BA301|nr:anion transporter [Candidatus Magnetaquicoccus inordinatus]